MEMDTVQIDEGLFFFIDIVFLVKELEWTLDNSVLSVVVGKTMCYFSGYKVFGQHCLYFCGDGGVFRVVVDGQWLDMDVSSFVII